MWKFPPIESRVKATPKSRKNLAKQKQESSIAAGTGSNSSEAQPNASTTLTAAGPSNAAQSPLTSGTTWSVSDGSSSIAPAAPAAPIAMSNEGNGIFSFTSAAATLSVSEGSSSTSTAPAAPVFFGMQRNAQFLLTPSATISASTAPPAASVAMSEPLVFGMQSNAPFSSTSGTLPVEEGSMPVAPSIVGSHSNIDPALNASAEPEEEESIEKMVADMEAELGNPSRSAHIPEDPNYGLDLNFGLDAGFVPAAAIPDAGQESNVTQYPDPTDQASGGSVPYFPQDSNTQQSDLPYSGLIPDLDTAHDIFAPDPFEYDPFASDPFAPDPFDEEPFDEDSFAQDPSAHDLSFDQKPNFALDPSLDFANETGNKPQFTASAQHHPDPSGTEYPDPNVQDNARSILHLIQNSRMEDSQDLARSSLYQDPSSPPGVDIVQHPLAQSSSAQGPLGQVPFSQEAFRQDPFVQYTLAQDPLVQASLAQASPAQDPIQDQSLLNPRSDLANEKRNSLPFATSAPPPLPSATQSPDPKDQDNARPLPYLVQDTSMEDLDLAYSISYQDPLTQDPAAQEPLINDLIAEDHVSKDPIAQDPVAPDPVAQDPVAQDPVAHDSILQQESAFPLDPHLGLANDSKLFDYKQCLPQTSSTTSGQLVHGKKDSQFDSSSAAAQVVILSKEKTGKYQREIRKLRAEIERKNKQIFDRDDKIRRSARELQDQDTKNRYLIKQYLSDLDKIRIEKSALEEANHGLEMENLEAQEIQSKAKKDKELIRKLNCELGRIRKKQSALVKENESLAKDCSELRGESEKLCESNAVLKEESCRLRASLDDLRLSRSELVEAKDTIRAQEAEIRTSAERIATLSTCIDEISPKLQWQTEELQEAEERVLQEESVSKYYKDRCCLLWDKCNALESAGDSRDTEFAKLEMVKEQRHKKELEALNLRIRDLEVANQRPAQGAKDVGGSAETKEADKVDEIDFDTYHDSWDWIS